MKRILGKEKGGRATGNCGNRLTGIGAKVNTSIPVNSYGYQYNEASQRTRVDWHDGSYVVYDYDGLGQVIDAKRFWGNGTPVSGQQYGYQYDNIGNRLSATTNGRVANYVPNALNQYTSRTVPSVIDVLGSADMAATVTVNGKPTARHGNYFAGQASVENLANPAYAAVRISAVKQGLGSHGKDVLSERNGNVFVAKTPEAFTYDADGNLTADGRWNYTWDGENRLVGMEARTNVPAAAKLKLAFAYDYRGRRVEKRVYQWDGSAYEASPSSITRFLYDGWNMVAELNGMYESNHVLRSYLWGLDLSGSQQGAGGVGGLLAMTDHTTGGTYTYTYDGNGNVVDVVAQNGVVAAHYEYSPFGEVVIATGTMATVNPFQFSTKYTDDETGLVYYGYRFYNSSTGRWVNRDPIEEKGGINLYGFVWNGPINWIDPLGLSAGPKPKIPYPSPSTPPEPDTAVLTCTRCPGEGNGRMRCKIGERGDVFDTNTGTNKPQIPAGTYDLVPKPASQMDPGNEGLTMPDNWDGNRVGDPNSPSNPEYPIGTPSITGPGRDPGSPTSPWNNVRVHGPTSDAESRGCITTNRADEIYNVMMQNGGKMEVVITDVGCKCNEYGVKVPKSDP